MPQLADTSDYEPVVQVRALEWRESTAIFRLESGRVVSIPARRYGTLAVHPTWCIKGREVVLGVFGVKDWTVMHLPSTLSVCKCVTQGEAEVRAEWLWGSCPSAWAGEWVDTSLLPPEVVQWCKGNII